MAKSRTGFKWGRFEFYWNGVEWIDSYNWARRSIQGTYLGPSYYLYCNWMDKENRYVGWEQMYYDGPHSSFGFWFFNIAWSTPRTKTWKENQ